MGFFVNSPQLLECGVGVDLCRLQAAVSQQLLDAFKSCPMVEH